MTKQALVISFFAAAVLWHALVFGLASRIRLVKPNFKGDPVMASYGIVMCVYLVAGAAALAVLGLVDLHHARLYAVVISAMAVLGAADDIFGSGEARGFRGHFRKLLFQRRLTTGAVKALGGGIVGISAGAVIGQGDPFRWITAALLIPLAANTINLLDLRPGRAIAVFFAGLGVTCLLAFDGLSASWIIGWIAIVAFLFGIWDGRARAMMGDSGANSLGAVLGLTIALNVNMAVQAAAIVVFAGIQIYSEKRSVSAFIEQNAILREIDRRLGVR